MSLTLEESRIHAAYDNLKDLTRRDDDLPGRLKAATDEAFQGVRFAIDEWGLKCGNTDRAEALVAHIFKFICESNELDPANFGNTSFR